MAVSGAAEGWRVEGSLATRDPFPDHARCDQHHQYSEDHAQGAHVGSGQHHAAQQRTRQCPQEYNYAVETRNPNYLNDRYFEFLNHHNLYHIFVQGYYMPHIMEVYKNYRDFIRKLSVIRLMGPDRKAIEKKSGKKWGAIVDPKDNEIADIVAIIKELEERKIDVYLNINNHYEGSAPLTIKKIQEAHGMGNL